MKTSVFLCSYSSYYAKGMRLLESVDLAVQEGYGAIEPYPTKELETIDDAKRLSEYADKRNIPVSCFSMGSDLRPPNTREVVRRLKHYIDIAVELKSPYFHHTLGGGLQALRLGDADFENLLPFIIPAVREVSDYGSERGITCVYEDQGFIFNGVGRFSYFLEKLDRKDAGVVADLGNILFVDETIEQFVGRFTNKIVHVHLKDYLIKRGDRGNPGTGWKMTRDGNYLRQTVFGHGEVAFTQAFRILQAAGYDGYYSAEYGALEPVDKWLPISMENMKRCYALAKL